MSIKETNEKANKPDFLTNLLDDERIISMYKNRITKFHVAMVVKRGKILAQATNKAGSRSKGATRKGWFIHAEKNLLLSLKGNYSILTGADIYVVRVGGSPSCEGEKELWYSKPCPECTVLMIKCLDVYGLKNVYYS